MGLVPQILQARENPSRIQEGISIMGRIHWLWFISHTSPKMDRHHGKGKVRIRNLGEKEQKKNVALLENVPFFGGMWMGPRADSHQARESPLGVSSSHKGKDPKALQQSLNRLVNVYLKLQSFRDTKHLQHLPWKTRPSAQTQSRPGKDCTCHRGAPAMPGVPAGNKETPSGTVFGFS